MAEVLLTLGAGGGAVGTLAQLSTVASPVLGVMSAVSGLQEGARQSAEYERQAQESRIMAGIEAERLRRVARQEQSRARAAMAEGGVLSGTSLDLLDSNAVARELDALTVEFRGQQEARGAEFQAQQSRGNVLDVFSSAVRGFSQVDPLNLQPKGRFIRDG